MKLLEAVLFSSLALASGAVFQSPAVPQQGAAEVSARVPGELDLEEGFVGVGPNWYQDGFGLVLETEDKHAKKLELTSRWETDDVLVVNLRSTMESGVEPNLHFQFAKGYVVKCWVDGRWRFDVGSKASDFKGSLRDVSGLIRVQRDTAQLSCLFTLRGRLWRNADPKGDKMDRVMGGFEISIPARKP
ncbi:MAG TPA: hypothetical protein VK843_02090 [Planctomycetota bacterium]|nr:hypothetical protein [Planctomycetota bacterium]